MGFKEEKQALAEELIALESELSAKRKRLEKLVKVQYHLAEPAPGSVIRFSRRLAGSTQKYTFVLARLGLRSAWYVTGTDNALRLLGLSNKGNAWEDVLVAAGDAEIKSAVGWESLGEYEYFQSNTLSIYRVSNPDLSVEKLSGGQWLPTGLDRQWLVENPGSFRKVTRESVTQALPS